ncbi:hypothetical protein [Microvirga pudoricolor]|uniref:hypothetical protein n=1 Tax=Microvirga pudoricolor TaxID=2778729 RepID=UPI0019513AD1|nr:hypothetical protein [Microvirga pudoricolor]MBM6596359.1 hypothetical protein [Microvirga pudoricolor]
MAARLECRHGIESATLAGASAMAYLALASLTSALLMVLSDAHWFGSFQDPYQTGIVVTAYGAAVSIPAILSLLIWNRNGAGQAWAGLACSALALGICAAPLDGWTVGSLLAVAASLQGLRGAYAARGLPAALAVRPA